MQNVLTATKLIVIVGFVIAGFVAGTGSWSHFSEPAVRTSTISLPTQFIVSLLWVMVGYSGWNAATYVAEEVRRPERTLPAALAVGTGLVAMLYLALNLVFIYSTPLENMKGVIAIGSLAASNLFGPGVAGAFSALMALCIVSTVNAEVTIGPRVYYAMAKNRAFFSGGGVRASAMAYAGGGDRRPGPVRDADDAHAVSATGAYIGMSLTLFTTLSVASLFVFRRRNTGWQRLRAVDFAWPLIPASYIAVGICMLVYGFVWQPAASFSALATVGAGGAGLSLRGKAAGLA